jgi:hypothetical protein
MAARAMDLIRKDFAPRRMVIGSDEHEACSIIHCHQRACHRWYEIIENQTFANANPSSPLQSAPVNRSLGLFALGDVIKTADAN